MEGNAEKKEYPEWAKKTLKHYEANDLEQAFLSALPEAEKGDANAQTWCGSLYYYGYKKINNISNYEEALRWYTLAAGQGDATAQYCLGSMYDWGHGVKQNFKEAVKLFKLSASQGYSQGQFMLGHCYHYGVKGLPKDEEKSAEWLKLSAAQGNQFALDLIEEIRKSK